MERKYTPENITELKDNEIFVFGSNSQGIHGKGAALTARLKFGAQWGNCCGLQGQSYAIVTKKYWWKEKSQPLEDIRASISFFLGYAYSRPYETFYVTKLGASLAGYTVEEMRGLFLDLKENYNITPSDNVILPKEYEIRE